MKPLLQFSGAAEISHAQAYHTTICFNMVTSYTIRSTNELRWFVPGL